MKILSDVSKISETNVQKKIDFLQYASRMLIELTKISTIHNVREVEYFLSMAAIEAIDALDETSKQLNDNQPMKEFNKAYRQ